MTTLSPDFTRTLVMMLAWRGEPMQQAQAFFLTVGLSGRDFTGADLPGEIAQGSKHLSGAAIGALLALELIEVVGRVKSPRPDAKGRKVNVLRLRDDKVGAARTLLQRWGYSAPTYQMELAV